MSQGTITRIVGDRGFGFIQPTGGGEDVFFHHSSMPPGTFDNLRKGQSVEYETGRDSRSITSFSMNFSTGSAFRATCAPGQDRSRVGAEHR